MLVLVEHGDLVVHASFAGVEERFALGRWDAAYLPLGSAYRLEGAGTTPVDVLVGVAPGYAPA